MAYFDEGNLQGEKKLPSNFITGFLEVSTWLLTMIDPILVSEILTILSYLGSQLNRVVVHTLQTLTL